MYQSKYYELRDEGPFLLLRRTSAKFEALEPMREEFRRVMAAFPPRGEAILVDARSAPARNDEEFETASKELRECIAATFGCVALIVETVAGAMQVQRLMRDEGVVNARVFSTEEAAASWLSDNESRGRSWPPPAF